MTPLAYRASISRLGLTQVQAGKWLSSGRSGRRWATDGPPKAVGMLLGLACALMNRGMSVEEVMDLIPPEDA